MKKLIGITFVTLVLSSLIFASTTSEESSKESEGIQTYKKQEVQRIYMEPMEIHVPVHVLDFTDEEPMVISPGDE